MKQSIQAALRKMGIDVLSLSYSSNFIYDHLLKEALKKYSVTTVLDIGANDGRFGLFLRKIGYRNKIYSFEPVHSTFRRLESTARRAPPWFVYNFALGNFERFAEINVMKGDDLCSFLEPFEITPSMSKIRTETVWIKRLDDFHEAIDWAKTFIKIDTQGSDLAVLEGGEQIIRRVPLLQTEASIVPIYQNMPTFVDIIQWLNARDFSIIGMFAVSRDEHLRVREFDCMLVNHQFINNSQV